MSWSVKAINKPVFPAVCLPVQALKKNKNKATKANRASERASLFVNVKAFLDRSQKSSADSPPAPPWYPWLPPKSNLPPPKDGPPALQRGKKRRKEKTANAQKWDVCGGVGGEECWLVAGQINYRSLSFFSKFYCNADFIFHSLHKLCQQSLKYMERAKLMHCSGCSLVMWASSEFAEVAPGQPWRQSKWKKKKKSHHQEPLSLETGENLLTRDDPNVSLIVGEREVLMTKQKRFQAAICAASSSTATGSG